MQILEEEFIGNFILSGIYNMSERVLDPINPVLSRNELVIMFFFANNKEDGLDYAYRPKDNSSSLKTFLFLGCWSGLTTWAVFFTII